MTPPLSILGDWVVRLRYRDIPKDALRAARYQILNHVAAVYSAMRSEETAAIGRAIKRFAGGGRSTLLATGKSCSPVEAAMGNAAYSMAQDFDDIIWMGHTGHSAVFASYAGDPIRAAMLERREKMNAAKVI